MLMHVAPIGTLIGQKSHKSFIFLSRIDFTLNKECINKSVCIPSDTLGVIKGSHQKKWQKLHTLCEVMVGGGSAKFGV